MPDRVFRDELLRSERYWSVSIEAQRLYVHLLLCADDTARFSGKNYTVRAACFPGQAVEPDKLERHLAELNDVDLIRLYCAGDERFIFIPRFRQRLRFVKSKYPDPPKGISDIEVEKSDLSQAQDGLKTVASQAQDGRSEEKRSKATPRAPTDVGLADGFSEFWSAYPKRRSKGEALKAWRALKPNEQLRTEILAGLQRAMNSAQWRKDDGQFIPHPATWLRAKGWEDELDQTDVSFRHGQARVGGFVP